MSWYPHYPLFGFLPLSSGDRTEVLINAGPVDREFDFEEPVGGGDEVIFQDSIGSDSESDDASSVQDEDEERKTKIIASEGYVFGRLSEAYREIPRRHVRSYTKLSRNRKKALASPIVESFLNGRLDLSEEEKKLLSMRMRRHFHAGVRQKRSQEEWNRMALQQ